jgi:capsular polysaccharide biosynthesis protein
MRLFRSFHYRLRTLLRRLPPPTAPIEPLVVETVPYLFDATYYRQQAGASLDIDADPYEHYRTLGWREGLKPHPFFDPDFYLAENPAAVGQNPLLHYLHEGWQHGHFPHPFFNVPLYFARYPDVLQAGMEPVEHYLMFGAAENRKLNALFDARTYVQDHPASGANLLTAARHAVEHDPDGARLAKYAADLAYVSFIDVTARIQRIDEWAAAHGMKVTPLSTAASLTWPAPHIINRPEDRPPITAVLPSAYVAILDNVVAFPGSRALLTPDNILLHDEIANPESVNSPARIQRLGRFENHHCMTPLAVSTKTVLDRAIILSGDTDYNYFHWLVEALPKLWLIEMANVPIDVPVLIPTGLHENLLLALRRVLGERPYIAMLPDVGVRVKQLWYPSDLGRVLDSLWTPVREDYDIVVSREGIRYVRDKLTTPSTMPATRKIYVERASSTRQLLNEPELIEALRKSGFEIINPARVTLDEQIALFSQSRLIIAPTGAAMTNLIFTQAGTHALIILAENKQSNLNIFNHVGEAVGATVSFCLGERAFAEHNIYSTHDDFTVDISTILDWCTAYD